MRHAAATFQGARVLLRGLGVGVRIGDEYVLFDRADGTEASGASPDAVYTGAVDWIREHGLPAPADGAARVRIAAEFRESALDHVAFTSADMPRAVETLRGRGAMPVRHTEDAVLFHARDGITVEIVRDTDAADAYWCPMHPDLRSSTAGKCPLCGMPLVPMPAPRIGEYRMDVVATAGTRGAAVSKLRVTLRDPETGKPVPAFATVHDRLLHLFIIDRTLEYFAHVHPEPAGEGVFEIDQRLPPGAYVVIADFLPLSGAAQTLQRAIVTPGYRGPLFAPPSDLRSDMGTDKIVAGLRVRLEASGLKAGREALLRFTLADASTGAPISDLEPFLGAAGHMLVVNADLTDANHAHPEEQAARGPSVSFQPRMPAAGLYKLWVQFQRKGQVITVPFVVTVQEP
jgi:heavy metal-binding protein